MGKVISLRSSPPAFSPVIIEEPLKIRWADWEGGTPLMVSDEGALKYERHRAEAITQGHPHFIPIPDHVKVKNGLEYTLEALLRHCKLQDNMLQVYYLAGLMECLLKVPQPILRTALVRNYYQTVIELMQKLSVRWAGDVRSFLFPLSPVHYSYPLFFNNLCEASTLKQLYGLIREGVEEQFHILGNEYIFYIPKADRHFVR